MPYIVYVACCICYCRICYVVRRVSCVVCRASCVVRHASYVAYCTCNTKNVDVRYSYGLKNNERNK